MYDYENMSEIDPATIYFIKNRGIIFSNGVNYGCQCKVSLDEESELLHLFNQLDPIKRAEFKGILKGYVMAENQ